MDEKLCGTLAIFDGVGGIAGGAFAASTAANKATTFNENESEETLKNALASVNRTLAEHDGCATTASGLLLGKNRVLMFHIGNTRIWFSTGEYFEQITRDQTLVEEHEDLSDEERDRISHIITGCLGGAGELIHKLIIRDVTEKFADAHKILFTCDGIHDYLDPFRLEKDLLGEADLASICQKARDAGSDDDCSVMLVDRME